MEKRRGQREQREVPEPRVAKPERRSAKERLLAILEQKGLLEDRGGMLVADIEQIRHLSFAGQNYEREDTLAARGLIPLQEYNRLEFFKYLRDFQVVSKEDFDSAPDVNRLHPKKLLYNPPTLEAALDPKEIQKEIDNSYLGIWDTGERTPWSSEITLADGEQIRVDELYFAKKIYGDLKGHRDSKGKLLVYDQTKKADVPCSAGTLHRLGAGLSEGKNTFVNSPVKYVMGRLSRLVRAGLLKPEDFGMTHLSATKLYRRHHPVRSNSMVYIDRAKYTLGGQFDTRSHPERAGTFSVVKLSPGIAAVLERGASGADEITHVFRLKSKEEIAKLESRASARIKAGDIKSSSKFGNGALGHVYFRRGDIELLPYRVTGQNPRFTGESAEAYAERISLITGFNSVEQFGHELTQKAGIGIHEALSWPEQQWLATAAKNPQTRQRILAGAKQFGRDFLRAFYSCALGSKNWQAVLQIAERSPGRVARAVFEKYGSIVDATHQVATELSEIYGSVDDETRQRVVEGLHKHAAGMLTRFSESSTRNQVQSEEELLEQLDGVKSEILLFATTFKLASETRPLDFVELAKTRIEVKDATMLSDAERKSMLSIFKANREGVYTAQLFKQVTEDFSETAQAAGKKFHLLWYGDSLAAFLHFEPRKDGALYMGSFNVRSEMKGSAVGSAMLHAMMDAKAREHRIEAVVWAENPMIRSYVEEFGFRLTALDPDYHGTGQPYFTMVRDDRRDAEFLGPRKSAEDIVRDAAEERFTPSYHVRAFDLRRDPNAYTQAVAEEVGGKGYTITRFLRSSKKEGSVFVVFEKSAGQSSVRPQLRALPKAA